LDNFVIRADIEISGYNNRKTFAELLGFLRQQFDAFQPGFYPLVIQMGIDNKNLFPFFRFF
jgi:hypothetical protein